MMFVCFEFLGFFQVVVQYEDEWYDYVVDEEWYVLFLGGDL